MRFEQFLMLENVDRDKIRVKRLYIDIAGDLVAGILLSQIVYWYSPSQKDGKPRLRVVKGGEYWLAKSRTDWWEECRVTPRQFDRAIQVLEQRGIIEKAKFRFNGSPTVHVRIKKDNFMQLIARELEKRGKLEFNESVKSNLPNGEIQLNESVRTLTDTTTESTTKDNIPYREIIEFLNQAANTNYRHQSKNTRSMIRARWEEGFRLEDFKTVIRKKAKEWRGGEYAKYLRPETLFRPSKFESYLNEPEVKKKGEFNPEEV